MLDYIKDILREGFRGLIQDIGEDINEVISRRLNRFKKQILQEFIGWVFILMAIGLLLISLIFFLVDYLGFDKTLSFLIIGIIIFIIGILIKFAR